MAEIKEACCNTAPTTVETWHKQGQDKVLGTKINGEDRKTYRTGPKDSKRGVIFIYDIFGFHPTNYQFFDRLAATGFQLSVPHVFKEAIPLDMKRTPAFTRGWLAEHGDFKKSHLWDMILAAVEDLKADGCTTFSILGACWGTWIAVQAASEPGNPFLSCGGPHPSMISEETVKDVTCPIILLASKDEDDMIPAVATVQAKGFAVDSFHKRFENMHHGWTGGKGDWSDPEQLKAGLEAIQLLSEFLAKVSSTHEAKL